MLTGIVKFENGVYKTFNNNNEIHSFGNQPARIKQNGDKYWYQNGKRHNDDRDSDGKLLPAVITQNGDKYWYQNGKLHNDDRDSDGKLLPAVVTQNGSKKYFINGKQIYPDSPEFQTTPDSPKFPTLSKEEIQRLKKIIELFKNIS